MLLFSYSCLAVPVWLFLFDCSCLTVLVWCFFAIAAYSACAAVTAFAILVACCLCCRCYCLCYFLLRTSIRCGWYDVDYGLILWLCFGLLARFSFLSGNSPLIGCYWMCCVVWYGLAACGCFTKLLLWGWCMQWCVGGLWIFLYRWTFFLFLLMVLCSFAGRCWSLLVFVGFRFGNV